MIRVKSVRRRDLGRVQRLMPVGGVWSGRQAARASSASSGTAGRRTADGAGAGCEQVGGCEMRW